MGTIELSTRSKLYEYMKRFSEDKIPESAVNLDQYDRALMICDIVDVLCNEFKNRTKRIHVDKDGNKITISVELKKLHFENDRSHPFFQYIRMADKIVLSPTNDEFVKIGFIIFNLFK